MKSSMRRKASCLKGSASVSSCAGEKKTVSHRHIRAIRITIVTEPSESFKPRLGRPSHKSHPGLVLEGWYLKLRARAFASLPQRGGGKPAAGPVTIARAPGRRRSGALARCV